ncbi:MAG: rhodanese-like domain-containing protein [Gammaproteobacteria bacterium]
MQPSEFDEISVQQLLQLRQEGTDFILLDVREPHEYAICNLGGYLLPLSELNNRLHELEKSKYYVVHCKSGNRSRKAVTILQTAGFKNVKNLTGGILAWAKEIDKDMPTY